MLNYYFRLALKSFARTPGLTALMICAIGLGIAVCVMTLTVYTAMAANPIGWKSDRLYTVTMDSWDPVRPADERRPHLPPPQLTYTDATHLFASDIPERKVIMYYTSGVIAGDRNLSKPKRISTRLATSDFFPMFEVPFQYGSGWSAEADFSAEPVIVLSKDTNDRIFGGGNSVGRTVRWNEQEFRVIGVLAEWLPMPKFYDLNNGAFNDPEDAFIPWGWSTALELPNHGNNSCWKGEDLQSFQDWMASECVWIQMWVELPTEASRERMQNMMDSYWAEQRSRGRFQRPKNNRLTNVSDWLQAQEAVRDDNRVLVAIAFAFLSVCLINTVGLLLAKFLNGAALSGVRRALGATRKQIFAQHLVEVGVLATAGALLGLALAAAGLYGVRALYANMPDSRGGLEELATFDVASVVWTIVLAVVAALAAGLYPAWRVGRLSPAVYLKNQ
jgi:putative ABC transport system permease protein